MYDTNIKLSVMRYNYLKPILHYTFHTVIYYVAWLGCILLAAAGHAWPATSLVVVLTLVECFWQHYIKRDSGRLISFVLIITSSGFIVDTLLLHLGIITFNANPFSPYFSAPWMLALWFNFSVFMYSTCQYFFRRYMLTGILAFLGFSLSYYVGIKLGAATASDEIGSVIVIGLIWLLLLPSLFYFQQRNKQ